MQKNVLLSSLFIMISEVIVLGFFIGLYHLIVYGVPFYIIIITLCLLFIVAIMTSSLFAISRTEELPIETNHTTKCHISEAVLCLNDDVVYNLKNKTCPVCGKKNYVFLSRIINREV